jgi:ABC-type transport system involved in multi-copper enzyme maturation permease subunit
MIARILNAYRAEIGKLLHRRIGHAAFLVALVGVLAAMGLASIGEKAGRLAGEKMAAINGWVAVADGIAYGVRGGALVLLIFAGLFMAEESELGTAKIVFSKPVRRIEVVAGKGLLLLTLSIALVIFVTGVSLALAALFYGLPDVLSDALVSDDIFQSRGEMFGHLLTTAPQLVPPLFASLMIAFLFSSLVEQSGLAVGLAFGFLVLSTGVSLFGRAEPFLVTTYYSFAPNNFRDIGAAITGSVDWLAFKAWRRGPPKLFFGAVLSLAYAGAAWLIAAIAVARRAILGLLAGAVVLLGSGAATPAYAGNHMGFDVAELDVTGQVWDVTPTDLDQDGQGDLVVFHVVGRRGPEPRRYISVFYGRAPGGYASKPDTTVEVDPEACVRFIADVDPSAKGQELGFIGPRGAFCYFAASRQFSTGRRKRLFTDEGFFDIAAGTQLPDWDSLVKDVDGDGRPDVVFPKKGSFALYLQKESGEFSSILELPLEYKQYFGTQIETLLLNRFINYWGMLSKPALADIDGNRRLDVVTYVDNSLGVFLQKSGGLVASSPFPRDPDRKTSLRAASEEATPGDDSFNSVNADFDDVDGDGLSDLILYRNVGKIGLFESMRTQVLFHRARKAEGWKEQPDQILNLKGISINPGLIDADGDGAKDLVVSSLRTDLMTNAKRALFSSVSVTYYVFRYDKEAGKFRTSPDYSRDLTIDIARIEGGGTIPLAVFRGDFNGDKLPDLLSLEENDQVRILPGKVEKGWFGKEKLDYDEDDEEVVKVATSNSYKIDDLDRDGKSDFLFWYFDKNWESQEVGKIRVALSR